MKDQWMNDCFVVYIEKDVTRRINNKEIILQFQYIKHHRSNCKTVCISVFFFFVMSIYSSSLLFLNIV